MPTEFDEGLKQSGLYLAHLIRCGLANEPARALPAGATWEQVHALAVRNSVEGATWCGAATRDDVPPNLRKRWEDEANRTLFRRLQFDAEREQVLAAMEERGLSYLPLKGILMAGYYPRPEMRSMADNDILYGFVEAAPGGGFTVRGATEAEREQTVREATSVMARIMRDRGYEAVELGRGNHDSFHREPLFNFEMHRQLMSAASPLYAYYRNPWARAVQSPSKPYAFSFSDEDEYVYVLAHASKHFEMSGCGIRFVVDLRVFLDAKAEALDWEYVRRELAELGLCEFEERSRKLARDAFGEGQMDDDDRELLWFLLGCGTYGNMQVRVEREVERLASDANGDAGAAKRRYLRERVFLDEARMRESFPAFYRHKALRPLLPIFRLVRGVARNPRKLLHELRILRNAK